MAVETTGRPLGAPGGVSGRFLRRRGAVASLVFLVLVAVSSVAGPALWRYTYADLTPELLAPPSALHPLGTDALGHDVLAQVMRGAQRSLAIALIVALVSTAAGATVGLLAGYLGGWLDALVMRLVDVLLTIPLIAVLGLVAVRLGGNGNGWLIVAFAVSAFYWAPIARIIRGITLSLRERDFVAAARLIGAGTPRVLARHLLPHIVGPVAVVVTTYVAAAISLESSLSFLGLGVQPPDTSLGQLVGAGTGFAVTAPWLFYAPSLIVIAIVLAVHFVGEGLRRSFEAGGTGAAR
ncbi:ABC transporter permease [Streptosporangium sp. NPDC051022]|uniref:ABC transporter permease n=1 Tax=Streptosporangium sp. NPDC051022 TaxID=3155752 RepID=UPI003429C875